MIAPKYFYVPPHNRHRHILYIYTDTGLERPNLLIRDKQAKKKASNEKCLQHNRKRKVQSSFHSISSMNGGEGVVRLE